MPPALLRRPREQAFAAMADCFSPCGVLVDGACQHAPATVERRRALLEHFTLEMPDKDLEADPCSQMIVGRLCRPSSNHLN